mgnify:FL=1
MSQFTTSLHNENTFYPSFIKDLENCKREVIIESPFITTQRMNLLFPILKRLNNRGVSIFIITRDPKEHIAKYQCQSESEIQAFETVGIQVFLSNGNHHRKLAIIDRSVLWEGSLNILSQTKSKEIMRRLEGDGFAKDMFKFLNYGKYI